MPRAKSRVAVIHNYNESWVYGNYANNDTFLMPSRVLMYAKLTIQAPAPGMGADQQVDLRQAQEAI